MSEYAIPYGWADRLLHRLALGLPPLAELTFDLDQKASRAAERADAVAIGEHVFVAGLARAGTTVLMRAIHDTGRFRSLTYRDMPFPLAPNLWKLISARWRKKATAGERAHGDGIVTSVDSPEALEQVFWRIEAGEQYIRHDGLVPHDPDARTLRRMRGYVAAILASAERGQDRYLSKNNDNVLRLPALLETFPQAVFLIPFRRPDAQAASLLRQHRKFRAMQRETPFVRQYMDWLVHHEFGLGHRPFRLGGSPAPGLTPEQPDYWLDTWTRVYAALSEHTQPRCLFVCYEDLCRDGDLWSRLAVQLDLPNQAPTIPFRDVDAERGDKAERFDFDPALRARADALYARLRSRGAASGAASGAAFGAGAMAARPARSHRSAGRAIGS